MHGDRLAAKKEASQSSNVSKEADKEDRMEPEIKVREGEEQQDSNGIFRRGYRDSVPPRIAKTIETNGASSSVDATSAREGGDATAAGRAEFPSLRFVSGLNVVV